MISETYKNGNRSLNLYDASGRIKAIKQYRNETLYDSVIYVYDKGSNKPHQVIKKSINDAMIGYINSLIKTSTKMGDKLKKKY